MKQFGALESLYARLDDVKKPALRAKLEAYREMAFLSRDLATLRTDLEVPYTWDDLRRGPVRRSELLELAKRWELKRLETIANEEGLDDAAAGAPAPGRQTELRAATGAAASAAAASAALPAAAPAQIAIAEPGETTSGNGSEPAAEAASAAPPAPAPGAETQAPPPVPAPEARPFVSAPPMRAAEPPQGVLDLFAGGTLETAGAELAALRDRLHEVRARAIHGLAILPVAEGESRHAALIGIALAARDGVTAYVPLRHDAGPNVTLERAREWLGPALADPSVPKVGLHLKRDAHALAASGFALAGFQFDVHLGSFLCDPVRDHTLEGLARDVLGLALPPLEPAAARGRGRAPLSTLTVAHAAAAAGAGVATLFPLADALRAQLESREQGPLYDTLEHPLIPVLLDMERHGIAIDRERLAGMSARAGEEMARLEARLHEMAGERINLLSGPQLARVLFEVLKLKPGRKTKTGYSTDQEVLEALAAEHPFPKLLLEYRLIAKLRSTYLEALPLQADPRDGRVHTTYHQAGAATGRLSSSNPNLQNIPMRTEQGREIRRAFVADPGYRLVGADYSQIELRVMAHLSGDPALIEAFRSGEDIHAATARRVFGLTSAAPTPEMRARAKVVNFGIMYGMGARSLAQQMGTGLPEAEEFIRSYFRAYAGVRDFLDASLAEARQRGYVQTLLGRRRWLPELSSANGGARALAERVAINTPIQGTAADLMKLAMIRVHAALKRQIPSARLLLQVHDELLLESPAAEAQAVSELVRAQMESVAALRVPLVASAGIGATWLDVH